MHTYAMYMCVCIISVYIYVYLINVCVYMCMFFRNDEAFSVPLFLVQRLNPKSKTEKVRQHKTEGSWGIEIADKKIMDGSKQQRKK